MFVSISGYVSGRTASAFALNPFISNETETTVEELVTLSMPLGSKTPGKNEVETILRSSANAGFNYIQAAIYIMSLCHPDTLIPGVRKLLFQTLDQDADTWYCWKEFSCADPNQIDQENARSAYRKFSILAEKFLSDLVALLQSQEEKGKHIEHYQRWCDIQPYFKCTSVEEVFERERLLFAAVLDGLVDWTERKELLNKLLNDPRLGAAPAVDRHFVDLVDAANYIRWQYHLNKIIDWVNAIGGTMHTNYTPTRDPPATTPSGTKKVQPAPKMKQETAPDSRCQYCHKIGHTADLCYSIKNKIHQPRDYSNRNYYRDYGRTYHNRPNFNGDNNRDNDKRPDNRDNGNAKNDRDGSYGDANKIVPGTSAPKLAQSPANTQTQPGYQTQYGRQIKPVNRGFTNLTQGEDPVGSPPDQEQQDPPQPDSTEQENHCLRTVGSATTDDSCQTEPPVLKGPHTMPQVSIILSGHSEVEREEFVGILDTASNLNFVSRPVVERLKAKYKLKETTANRLVIETMGGSYVPKDLKQVVLSIALKDASGSCTEFTKSVFLIHEGHIPGRNDFLLNSNWITANSIVITGTVENGYDVRVSSTPTVDKLIQADVDESQSESCCCSFAIEPDGDDDPFPEDDIELARRMKMQPSHAVKMGPLSSVELETVSKLCQPIPMDICFKPGCEHPPINKLGYPTNPSNEPKLIKLLDTLVEEGVLAETNLGSGTFVTPGFPKQKGPDKVRLLVDLKPVNARMVVPPELRYHNATTWATSVPSTAKWFSCLDIKNAFYTIPCTERSQPFLHMSIWTRKGYRQYIWRRMPQGLCISPSWWVEHLERCVNAMKAFLLNHHNSLYREACSNVTVLVYCDDVLIAGADSEHVRLMTDILHQHFLFNRMYVAEDKLQHTQQSVEVMGFKLGPGTLQLNSKNVKKVTQLTVPATRKELNTALGLLNWLKWSLPDRELLSNAPLNCLFELRDGRGKFQWEPRHQEAWKTIVDGFQNLAMNTWSTLPGTEDNANNSLCIMSDASDLAVGWAAFILPLEFLADLDKLDLPRLAREGVAKLVSIGSKRLTGHEKQYISFDKEGFGIFTALSKCRPYIRLVEKTILFSDNRTALARLRDLSDADVNLTRGRRWLRWANDLSDILQGPRPVIMRHVAGPENTIADYMSRYCLPDLGLSECSTQTDTTDSIALMTLDDGSALQQNIGSMNEFDPTVNNALKQWEGDNSVYIKRIKLSDIWRYHLGYETEPQDRRQLIQASKRFHVVESILYMRYKGSDTIVVPDTVIPLRRDESPGTGCEMSLRQFLAKHFHEDAFAGHRGERSTLATVRRLFWWPSMDQTISAWVQTCLPCQIMQARAGRSTADFRHRIVTGPNVLLVVDWIGPLQPNKEGHIYILVMVCGFSGFTMCKSFLTKDSVNTTTAILDWCSLFGTPRYWTSDRDSTFVSQVSSDLRKLLKIRDIDSPAYSPMTQGVVERKVQDVKRCIEKFTGQLNEADMAAGLDWSPILRACVWASNTSEKLGTGLSSFEILMGRAPLSPLAVALTGYSLPTEGLFEDESVSEYVNRLKVHLQELREYWFSKVNEARARSNDYMSLNKLPTPDLNVGDKCLRLKYINGRREVTESVVIIDKQDSMFICQTSTGSQVLCNGYQLVRINQSPGASQTSDESPETTLEELRIRNIRRELKALEVGHFVASVYRNTIYIGQLQTKYVSGHECEILFWVPIGHDKFRLPNLREAERWAEITNIQDIILTDIQVHHLSPSVVLVPTGQFGGRVV
jgi:hypothetical protein